MMASREFEDVFYFEIGQCGVELLSIARNCPQMCNVCVLGALAEGAAGKYCGTRWAVCLMYFVTAISLFSVF